MLSLLKRLSRSWIAVGLFGLLIISFAIFGVNDAFRPSFGNWIVKAGSNEVGVVQFQFMLEQYKTQLAQRFQGQAGEITDQMLVDRGADKQLLQEILDDESMLAMMDRLGLRASKAQQEEILKQQTAFFDPITGKFDEAKMVQLLGERKMTPELFRKQISRAIIFRQIQSGLAAGMETPRLYTAVFAAYGLEERDSAYAVVTPGSVGAIPPPTEAELQAFITQNAEQLRRPELRTVQVARFSVADFEAGITIPAADIEKRFNFRKDSLSKAETRSVIQINVKTEKQAQDVIGRLNRGEDPAAVAKSVGADPIPFEQKPRSAFFDPTIANAAFTLPEGGVSGVLKGQFGLAVVKVMAIQAGVTATLEENREAIEADLKKDAAAEKAYAAAQAFDEARKSGSSFAEAAAKSGAKVYTVGPVGAQGEQPKNAAKLPEDPALGQIVQVAFQTSAGAESDLIEVSSGEQFAVRVEKIDPPAVPPLAEIREDLVKLLVRRKQTEKMQALANEIQQRVQKGESLEAVAASKGLKVEKLDKLSRVTAQAQQEGPIAPQGIAAVITAAKNQVLIAPGKEGFAVVQVREVRAAAPKDIAMLIAQFRQQMSGQVFQDMAESLVAYSKDKVKGKYNLERARAAMSGVDLKALREKEKAEKAKGEPKAGEKK